MFCKSGTFCFAAYTILDKEQSVSLYVNAAIRYYHDNRR